MIDTKALRNKILDLAIQGKLTQQLPEDGTAEDFYCTFPTQPKKCNPINTEELFFNLPINWKWCRFSDVAEFHLGKTPTRGDRDYWEDGLFPWVSIADMTSKNLVRTKEKVSKKAANECFSKGITPKGTMIMSFKLSIGKVSILGVDAFHNEAIISIFPRNDFDNVFRDYLMFVLPYSASHGKIYGAVKGNTLNKDSLSDLLIPLPPLSEQKRIVEKIEQLFSVLDTIDALQAQYADNLKSLKNKLIGAAIQGKLTEQLPEDGTAEKLYQQIQKEKQKLIESGKIKKEKPLPEITEDEIPFEIPENWKWVRLGDYMDVRDGTHESPEFYAEGYPLVTSKNLKNGEVDLSNVKFISKADYDSINLRSKVDEGDILFAMIGSIGNPAIVGKEHVYAIKNVALFKKIIPECNEYYIYYYFYLVQFTMREKARGGLQPFVSLSYLRRFLLPLPPLSEQRRIVERLDELLALCGG